MNLTAKAPSANMAHVRLHEEAKKKAAGQRQRDAELYEVCCCIFSDIKQQIMHNTTLFFLPNCNFTRLQCACLLD